MGRSVMSHRFSQVPRAEIPRASFDRSHGFKTTFNAGFLVPIFVDEVLPGDTFKLRSTLFARMASPLKTPIMDNLFIETFFFFVPNRLIWTHWEQFNGQQANPGDSISFLVPQIQMGNAAVAVGDLGDYFGLPTGVSHLNFNSLHFRAYNLIWNEWFRDQNLQNSVPNDVGDGPDAYTDFVLKRRGRRHDYFTSCLPWPQKGGIAVSLPLGTSAPVVRTSNAGAWGVYTAGSNAAPAAAALSNNVGGTLLSGAGAISLDPIGGLTASLSMATAATINQIRQAFQIQRLLERDARGGTRYTEIVRSHFGVVSPDARLQRPEFLGGGSGRVNVNPVVQTSQTNAQPSAAGTVTGYSTAAAHGHGFTKSFTEHGVLIGLVNVRADQNYQQGLNKMWTRQTRYDFYWPAFAHLGEQAVLNQEIYAQGLNVLDGSNNPYDTDVFGYQERHAEYRFKPSVITGQFRSTYVTPLDYWHLAVDYVALPVLNDTFIQDTPPMSRVEAVTSVPDFLLDVYHQLICARPMPVYGVPGFMDRF